MHRQMKLEWALVWLKILKRSAKDEIFSMGIHQWIELSCFLVGLQDYSLMGDDAKPDLTPLEFEAVYEQCLHSILVA